MICGEIARTTKVALTGDGGDEFFYGYAIFRAQRLARFASLCPTRCTAHVIRPLAQSLPASNRYMSFDLKLKAFAKGFPALDHLRNFYWTCAFSDRELPRSCASSGIISTTSRRQLGRMQSRWEAACGPLGRLAYLYQQQYLPDYVLPTPTASSMLHSVELRTPFLSVRSRAKAQFAAGFGQNAGWGDQVDPARDRAQGAAAGESRARGRSASRRRSRR